MVSSLTSRKKGENPIIQPRTGNPELDRLLSPFCYVRFIHLIRHMYMMTLKKTRTTSGMGVFGSFFSWKEMTRQQRVWQPVFFCWRRKKALCRLNRSLKDISFRESLFSPWTLPQNNKGSVNVFVHGSRRTISRTTSSRDQGVKQTLCNRTSTPNQ